MYNALDIARYVINYCNKKGYLISNLRLQKLLYFIQANFIMSKKKLCFSEPIECWQYGPVIRNVYLEFKVNGSDSIESIDKYEQYNLDTNSFDEVKFNFDFKNEEDKELVEETIEYASEMTTRELVDITHKQTPWSKNYKSNCKKEIPEEDMFKYFS